jgi:hypothetical protein
MKFEKFFKNENFVRLCGVYTSFCDKNFLFWRVREDKRIMFACKFHMRGVTHHKFLSEDELEALMIIYE